MTGDILDRLTNRAQLEEQLKAQAEAAPPPKELPFIARFLGLSADAARKAGQVTVNADRKDPLIFSVCFQAPPALSTGDLTRSLRAYHPSLADAVFEVVHSGDSGFSGLAGWGGHVIRMFGINAPLPPAALEEVVHPAHYPQELKQQARAHKAHALLFSMGHVTDPLEEYVALAVVNGVLAQYGAIIVGNAAARTSFPAAPLAAGKFPGDTLEGLRTWPFLMLYCGLVKHQVQGIEGVWMRSYGAHKFGLPDLAALIPACQQPKLYFDLFHNAYIYLRQTGAKFAAGQTAQMGEHLMRLRAPAPAEYFLQSPGGLVVVELVKSCEIN